MKLSRKMCSRCKKFLPVCNGAPSPISKKHTLKCKFHQSFHRVDGHYCYCRECVREINKKPEAIA